MTKNLGNVIVSVVLFALLLSGCKLPASQAPTTPPDEIMTTPIRIQTDSPELMTQTTVAEPANTATLSVDESPAATPTNTPEPTVVVPTLTRPAEYTVKDGEYPYCLARRFDLNPEDLLSLNNIGGEVSPGTTLQIPQTGSWPGDNRALNPHPTTHTVASAETIYEIACYYGDVSPEAIIAVNQLEEPYTVTPGQTLNIP